MKSFFESLLASVMFLGFFWLPLSSLFESHALFVIGGIIMFILIFTPVIHEFYERYPISIRPLDHLRHLFRRRFFL